MKTLPALQILSMGGIFVSMHRHRKRNRDVEPQIMPQQSLFFESLTGNQTNFSIFKKLIADSDPNNLSTFPTPSILFKTVGELIKAIGNSKESTVGEPQQPRAWQQSLLSPGTCVIFTPQAEFSLMYVNQNAVCNTLSIFPPKTTPPSQQQGNYSLEKSPLTSILPYKAH